MLHSRKKNDDEIFQAQLEKIERIETDYVRVSTLADILGRERNSVVKFYRRNNIDTRQGDYNSRGVFDKRFTLVNKQQLLQYLKKEQTI